MHSRIFKSLRIPITVGLALAASHKNKIAHCNSDYSDITDMEFFNCNRLFKKCLTRSAARSATREDCYEEIFEKFPTCLKHLKFDGF